MVEIGPVKSYFTEEWSEPFPYENRSESASSFSIEDEQAESASFSDPFC